MPIPVLYKVAFSWGKCLLLDIHVRAEARTLQRQVAFSAKLKKGFSTSS
jgi:hypothetical protein